MKRQQGAAAVEFAILVIPLLIILTGITEYGRALYYYNAIAKAARDGARLLSTQTPADPGYGALVTKATCTAVYGNSGCTGQPLAPGLTTAMVSVCDPASCPATHLAQATGTGVVNLVTLTVGAAAPYQFASMAPFMPALFGVPSFNFAPINVTMRQIL
jgi:Flp pilus assembly protein TadG